MGSATGTMEKRAQSEDEVSSAFGVVLDVGWVLLDAGLGGMAG